MKNIAGRIVLSVMLCSCLNAASALDLNQLKSAADDLKKQRDQAKNELDQKAKSTGLIEYSDAEESAIGRQIAGTLLGAAPLVKDAKLQKYVNNVGRWVASQSERPDIAWHFGVIASPDINAFAAPGGYIFVTLGLYKTLNEES